MLAGLSRIMGWNEKVEKSNWIPRTISTVDKFSQQNLNESEAGFVDDRF